ncbi:hypothetical protein JCM6882_008298 [Rhodosporidiobolus microsporus]
MRSPSEPSPSSHSFPPFTLSSPSGKVPIPSTLPSPPHVRPLDFDALDLDDDLKESGAPLPFVQQALYEMADALLSSVAQTNPCPPSSPQQSTQRLPFFPPPAPLPRPTCAFALLFADTQEHVLLPAHGLVWALSSPRLSFLGRNTSVLDDQDRLQLPVVHLTVPSKAAWPLLHDFVYTSSSAALLTAILSPPPSLSSLSPLAIRLDRVRQLWHNAVALDIVDETFWSVLRRAWDVLVQEATAA